MAFAIPTRTCLLGAALVAALPAAPAGQNQAFRASARTVPVYVTVTGPDGRLVPDLDREHFEIYDNGRPVPITVFSRDTQPIRVVLMLDRSGSVAEHFRLVQAGAEEFVKRLLPEDMARIGSFADRVQVDPREFTADRDELLRILGVELQQPGPTPLWNAISVAMTALLHEDARRVVLVFTDGVDAPGNNRLTNMTLPRVVDRARREDVMVYGVGLAGRNPGRGPAGFGPVGRGRFGPPAASGPDPGLAELAAESGGGFFQLDSTRDLAATFARVAEELHQQYALGFTPAALDGRVHEIEVRVRGEGLRVRARRTYVAPRAR